MTLYPKLIPYALVAILSFGLGLYFSGADSLKIKLSATGFELETKSKQAEQMTKAFVSIAQQRKP